MKILRKWSEISLVKRITAGLIAGVILGLVLPETVPLGILGDVFVGALRALAPLLVFFIVMYSLSNHQKGQSSNMGRILILYAVSTVLAAITAVAASFIFPMEITLGETAEGTAPQGIGEVLESLVVNAVSNPIGAITEANYISVLVWAVIFGMALRAASDNTKDVLSNISDMLSTAIRWVINCAPFGIMGLVFTTVSTVGIQALASYGKIILVLVGCMAFVAFVTNPIIVFLNIRQNPYPLVFKCIKDSGIMAFFTRSSAANIPVNMALCERLGLDEEKYSISIPLGATINMAGAAVTITVLSMATANTVGVSIDIPTAILLSLVASISAAGTSGVAGGSLLLVPLACSLLGISSDISMQVVAVGFIIGVIQDSCETAVNSSSDVLFTAAAEFNKWKKEGKKIEW
ncbi:MAG TPA: serine/threonine transporter SstT [Candidatus Copromorpha excrementigallinarum]|uniref:Serine/threonine transporter SstT n=1 Tax=Candidatus Allocopromorpha excrementigallinarum TaxID=2840742 RepID=A0A9D1I233_9FIRM|nr:serine/threonine transporter SstT [Candidatus Copromorpha excrementigallinarum]